MKFVCIRSCFDNSSVVGYRIDQEYDLSPKAAERLYEIGLLERNFRAADFASEQFLRNMAKKPAEKK